MPYPSSVGKIEQKIEDLAANYSAICTRVESVESTYEGGTAASPGRKLAHLQIGTGTGSGRPRILIVSGMHAREFAPPDAVLTFVEKLLEAYTKKSPIEYKKFVDRRSAPHVTYKEFKIPFDDVKRIVERTELYVLPLANPDGRAFAMSSTSRRGWRKNRRPAPPGATCPPLPPGIPPEALPFISNDPAGVDLNRNFDIAWDFDKYYSAASVASLRGSGEFGVSDDPCTLDQTFHGPPAVPPGGPASEPETRTVQGLLSTKRINFYVDVHSFAGAILFPWGIAPNQNVNNKMTFQNHALDSGAADGRDVVGTSPYAEWLPPGTEINHRTLGETMRDADPGQHGVLRSGCRRSVTGSRSRESSQGVTVQGRSIVALIWTCHPGFYDGRDGRFRV